MSCPFSTFFLGQNGFILHKRQYSTKVQNYIHRIIRNVLSSTRNIIPDTIEIKLFVYYGKYILDFFSVEGNASMICNCKMGSYPLIYTDQETFRLSPLCSFT